MCRKRETCMNNEHVQTYTVAHLFIECQVAILYPQV